MALLADAGHNFSDVAGLLLAWGASYLARRKGVSQRYALWKQRQLITLLSSSGFNG